MSALADLQSVLDREIPMCAQMGIRVESQDQRGLCVSMPLGQNRNHQQTAFAGSLNALCTIAGWGATYLQLKRLAAEGVIVIRRSAIKYHRPASTSRIVACCLAPAEKDQLYFAEMLSEKGQAKLDLVVEIAGEPDAANHDRPAVSFHGSYVVMPPGS